MRGQTRAEGHSGHSAQLRLSDINSRDIRLGFLTMKCMKVIETPPIVLVASAALGMHAGVENNATCSSLAMALNVHIGLRACVRVS